jgi:hypothetical protein
MCNRAMDPIFTLSPTLKMKSADKLLSVLSKRNVYTFLVRPSSLQVTGAIVNAPTGKIYPNPGTAACNTLRYSGQSFGVFCP